MMAEAEAGISAAATWAATSEGMSGGMGQIPRIITITDRRT